MDGGAGVGAPVRTTCPYCGVGCGVRVQREGEKLRVSGDETHPANFGRLCVKGSTLAETVVDDTRLLTPMLRDGKHDALRPASWDDAIARAADGFARIIDAHGPDAVAFYVSGQLLTEDYYVANKLMKGYIGSANIDTNSRLCMSSAVAGHKRAFGEDVVPADYKDVEAADLIVLVGSNLAWCHPVLYQRLIAARTARPDLQVVVIDPRRTASCDIADLHLPLAPGSDVALFNGLLCHLHDSGCMDSEFVDAHSNGLDEALAAAASDSGAVAQATGLDAANLADFYARFAACDRVVTLFSQGVNQSSRGTDKVNAIINCHLLTGRIGRVGCGPFSITGQPNAMGGREVGGLSNQLAAHLELNDPGHRDLVQGFWQSPTIADTPGYKAVDLFEAVHDGRVKAVWIMATNPVVSMPDADRVRAALDRCELVVVSEAVAQTDTTQHADVLLPAASWGERDGTVTNSERVISRQRPFRSVPGEARPDWWIICEFARRLGHADAFAYSGPDAIFDEHARLSGFGNNRSRDGGARDTADPWRVFNIEGLAGMTAEAYDELPPTQWPARQKVGGSADARPYEDFVFSHPDGRARFIATPSAAPANAVSDAFPLILNTGRVRDQWHTMTRTGLAPTLAAHRSEPYLEIHPVDAACAGVSDGALAQITTQWGEMTARVVVTSDTPVRVVFVPIHWNDQNASAARVGALVNPVTDALSGEPEFKHTPVRVAPFKVAWCGFIMTRATAIPTDLLDWWIRISGKAATRYEVAGKAALTDARAFARRILCVPDDADWIEYADATHAVYRGAWLKEDHLQGAIFISATPDTHARAWLAERFSTGPIALEERTQLLAGEASAGTEAGPTVCACFGVGSQTIIDAITDDGLRSTSAITAKLKAGGNCGSCLPEIRKLLAERVPLKGT